MTVELSDVREAKKQALLLQEELESKERIERCRHSLLEFFKTYLPHHFFHEFGSAQLELISELEKANNTGLRECVIFPREHGKTTIIEFFALKNIAYKEKKFIIIICDSRDQSSLMLQSIVDELEGNDLFIKDFGDLVGKSKWGKFEILTSTGIRLMARGAKSAVRGLKSGVHRPDLVLLDDLENDQNSETVDLRNKLERWLKRAVLNTVKSEGDVIYVGTIIHWDSLLLRISKETKTWKSKKMSAIEGNKIAWEAHWSKERLEKKREEIGSEAFSQEFLNNPVDTKDQPFKRKFLKTYNLEKFEKNLDKIGPLNSFLTWDIAWSEKKTAHWTAMSVISVDIHNNWWVRDLYRDRVSEKEAIDKFFELYYKYNCLRAGMETVFRQKYFKEALQEEMIRRNKFPDVEDLKRDTANKTTRIRSQLGPRWELGLVYYPEDHPLFTVLVDETIQFPKSKSDDVIDCLSDHVQIAFPPIGPNGDGLANDPLLITITDPETGTIFQRDLVSSVLDDGFDVESWLK